MRDVHVFANELEVTSCVSVTIRDDNMKIQPPRRTGSVGVKIYMTSIRRKTLHEFFRPEEYQTDGDSRKTLILFLEADIQTDSGTVTVQSGDIVSLKNNKNGNSSGMYQVLGFHLVNSIAANVIFACGSLSHKLLESVITTHLL